MDTADPDPYLQSLLSRGAYSEAEAASRLAIGLYETNASLRNILAIALERQGRFDDAIIEARKTVRLSPPDANREIYVALLQLKKGDPVAAVETARSVLASHPNHAQSNSVLREALERSGQFDEALAVAEATLAARPGDANLQRDIKALRKRCDLAMVAGDLIRCVDPDVLSTLHMGYGRLMFSQFGEDGVLLGLLRNVHGGFYVNVGAHHPYRLSNTAMLHVFNNWHGINIDADERAIAQFRIHRPNDVNLCCGVGPTSGTAKMAMFEDGAINTFNPDWVEQQTNAGGRKVMEMRELEIRTLPEILDMHLPSGQEIDLLNVDAEGWDTAILESNDWNRFRPKLILVEDHRMNLMNVSESRTYTLLHRQRYSLFSYVMGTSVYRSL